MAAVVNGRSRVARIRRNGVDFMGATSKNPLSQDE